MVFSVHAGSRGSTPAAGTCPNDFSDPIDQEIHTQCALSWKIVVSERRSVIAVSLNIGGGVCRYKRAKLHMCRRTHYKHDEDGRTALLWFCTTEPLGERHHENWLTQTFSNILVITEDIYLKLKTSCLLSKGEPIPVGEVICKLF